MCYFILAGRVPEPVVSSHTNISSDCDKNADSHTHKHTCIFSSVHLFTDRVARKNGKNTKKFRNVGMSTTIERLNVEADCFCRVFIYDEKYAHQTMYEQNVVAFLLLSSVFFFNALFLYIIIISFFFLAHYCADTFQFNSLANTFMIH